METIIIVLIAILWIAFGLWGFIYWWTTEYDLDISNLIFGIIISVIGPGTWLMGWIVHSPEHKSRVLIKKRNRNE